ncbi:NACHT, LRR and PYD domains-containing protein 1-like isoform X2 [Pezoporus occidentalis]|uniref:NACHT, LRR and PYD domains-containing protein 1-like isoform X2 n=1 Tax=Pezoporus occidentalis TaxID=407982 RepID=UPI002F90CF1C
MAERDPKEGDGPFTFGAVVRTRVASRYKPLRDDALGSSEMSDDELEPDSDPDPPLQGNCCSCIREDLPQVMPEIIREAVKHRTTYQAHLPGAGIFQCSITGLGFKVKSAVTITYRYATWSRHLSKADEEMWVPAGPLFHIKVQPRVVQEVHLPHFICLAEGVDTSVCSIAHFKFENMILERPTRVAAFSAVLRNPSFSLLGVLWRKLRSTLYSFPMHSLVLIYQQLRAANTTFHLYLIPDDNSVKQAIENQEKDWNTKLIPKPPPFSPLFFGCIYQVTSTDLVVITPDRQGCRELYCFQVAKIFHDIHPQKDCRAHPKAPESSFKDDRAKLLAVSGKSSRSHNLQPGKFRLNVGKNVLPGGDAAIRAG